MTNEPETLPDCSAFPRSLVAGLDRGHLPSLDGIRAIAAFMVVFYHLNVLWISGGTGVLVFFVLSGFLITWLLLKEEEQFGKLSLRLFYMRRTLRIMPAFYVYWFLIVGSLIAFSKHLHIAQAVSSFFYVNNYYQAVFGDPNTGLSHTWSLGVEEQFYLLWPICFILLKRNQNRLRFLLCATAGVWIYRELLVFVFHDPQGYIYEAFDTRADHLMIGCLLAVALKEKAWPRIWSALTAIPNLIWVTFAALLCSGAAEHFLGVRYRDGVGFILEPILAAALIVQGVAHGSSGLGRILNWSWVSYLGAISYSIYLYHPISIGIGRRLAHKLPLVSEIAALAVVIIVSSLSYLIVEKPMLRLRSSLLAGQRGKASWSEPDSAAELVIGKDAVNTSVVP